jgi:hypothetical protein
MKKFLPFIVGILFASHLLEPGFTNPAAYNFTSKSSSALQGKASNRKSLEI